MVKRLSLLGAAIAAFAILAMPAAASASPRLFENSNPLATGSHVVLHSTNVLITNTPFGTEECQTWASVNRVDNNSSSGGILAPPIAYNTSGCFEGTITEPRLGPLSANSGDSGALTVSFTVDIGPFECFYLGLGSFTFTTQTDVLKVPGVELESTSEICEPEIGTAKFEGDFTVTTTDGTSVTFG